METIVLKTAIIVDQMGHGFGEVGPEEEIEEHKKDFAELLYPAVLDSYTPYGMSEAEVKQGTDLIIFDYGGMMPGNSLMEDNSRRLIEFAQNHSSTLCVVVSTFTWRNAIQYEMEELGLGELHNVVCRFWQPKNKFDGITDLCAEEKEPLDFEPIPAWFRDMHKLPFIEPSDQVGGRWYVDKTKKLKKPERKK
jgi:hypothetical protein